MSYVITKESDNNVSVRASVKRLDFNDQEIEVLKEEIESYGEERWNSENARVDEQIDYWTNVDLRVLKDTNLADLNKKKAMLDAVRTRLDGDDGEKTVIRD